MIVTLLWLILFVQVIILLSKRRGHSAFYKLMAESRAEATAHYDEEMVVLEAVRDMATSARDNRKETAVAVGQVKEQLSGQVKKLEDLPEKTAAKMVEKLPGSKDDWRGHEGTPL